jgi:hypothetical protein
LATLARKKKNMAWTKGSAARRLVFLRAAMIPRPKPTVAEATESREYQKESPTDVPRR